MKTQTDQRESTIRNIHSILHTANGGTDIFNLTKNYHVLTKQEIRHAQLGYNSLEEFLCSVDSLKVWKDLNGSVHVFSKTFKFKTNTENIREEMFARSTRPVGPVGIYQPPHIRRRLQSRGYWKLDDIRLNAATPNDAVHEQSCRFSEFFNQQKRKTTQANFLPPFANTETNQHLIMNPKQTSTIAQEFIMIMKQNWKDYKPTFTSTNLVTPIKQQCSECSTTTMLSPVMQRLRLNSEKSSSDSNESDSQHSVQANPIEFIETGDVINDLLNFTRFHQIADPQIVVMPRYLRFQKREQFDCKIKVDGSIFSSYPNDFFDETSAKSYACKEALEKLMKKYGRTRHQFVSMTSLIKKRVPPLVAKHLKGVWSWQIEADYADMYNEVLPTNWLKIIEETCSPIVTVEKFGDKFILRLNPPKVPSDDLWCGKMAAQQDGEFTFIVRKDQFKHLPQI